MAFQNGFYYRQTKTGTLYRSLMRFRITVVFVPDGLYFIFGNAFARIDGLENYLIAFFLQGYLDAFVCAGVIYGITYKIIDDLLYLLFVMLFAFLTGLAVNLFA